MRNLLIFLTCLVFIIESKAQSFAPIGSKWYYSHDISNTLFPSSIGYIEIECVKDTVINSVPVRAIEIRNVKYGSEVKVVSREYLRENGDSIFYYNQYENQFYLLYNFGAHVGDTIVLENQKAPDGFLGGIGGVELGSFAYTITDIDTFNVQNVWHKRQFISDIYPVDRWRISNINNNGTVITSLFGASTYLFGTASGITPETIEPLLRCYNDSLFSFTNPDWTKACDYSNGIQSTLEIIEENHVKTHPNPCNDILFVSSNRNSIEKQASYFITDLTGKKIATGNLSNNAVDVSNLTSGMYFVYIGIGNQHFKSSKFIKL